MVVGSDAPLNGTADDGRSPLKACVNCLFGSELRTPTEWIITARDADTGGQLVPLLQALTFELQVVLAMGKGR
jgi:hypothetical protein